MTTFTPRARSADHQDRRYRLPSVRIVGAPYHADSNVGPSIERSF